MTARPRVVLKPVRGVADVGLRRWCRWLNDRRTSRYLESDGRWTPKRLAAWVDAQLARPATLLYVIGRPPGRLIGTLKLEDVWRGRWANLGLMVGEPDAGRALGPAAIKAACRIARRQGCAGVWAGMRVPGRSVNAFSLAKFEPIAWCDDRGISFCGDPPPLALREIVVTAATRWVVGSTRLVMARRFR